MKPRTNLTLNTLEDRTTPALSFVISGGNLLIQGTSDSGTVTVRQTAANSFYIEDGAFNTTKAAITRDVFVQPTNSTSVTVDYDANNFTSPGNVTIRLGNGGNTFNLVNGVVGTGSIKGALNVFSGSGDDTFNIGGATAGQLTKFAWLNLGAAGGQNDIVDVTAQAVPRGLSIQAAETVTVTPNVTTDTTSDVNVQFADGFNTLLLSGNTKRNVNVSVQNVTQSFLDLTFNGTIGGSLDVRGGSFNSLGFLTADINGDVTGNLTLLGTGGSDLVDIDAAVTPGNIGLNLYGGDNTALINTPTTQSVIVYGGAGIDDVTIGGTAKYLAFSLGDGDDILNVNANISININGFTGAGNDTVNITSGAGTAAQTGVSAGVDLGAGDDTITVAGTFQGGVVILGQAGNDTINLAIGSVFNKANSAGRVWFDGGADNDTLNQNGAGLVATVAPNQDIVITNIETDNP
jgi:hypothetical protein